MRVRCAGAGDHLLQSTGLLPLDPAAQAASRPIPPEKAGDESTPSPTFYDPDEPGSHRRARSPRRAKSPGVAIFVARLGHELSIHGFAVRRFESRLKGQICPVSVGLTRRCLASAGVGNLSLRSVPAPTTGLRPMSSRAALPAAASTPACQKARGRRIDLGLRARRQFAVRKACDDSRYRCAGPRKLGDRARASRTSDEPVSRRPPRYRAGRSRVERGPGDAEKSGITSCPICCSLFSSDLGWGMYFIGSIGSICES
jgi:hypothetical protein